MPRMKVKDIQMNDTLGQKEATMTVTNDSILFLQEVVNMYVQGNLGDPDDSRFIEVRDEVQQDLHNAWKALNPS